jgi:hypothetical protein
MDELARNPVACGALGRYDEATLEAIVAALAVPMTEIHRDRRSALWLDREPLRWRSGLTRGVAWSETYPPPDPGGVRSWEDAARELNACGVVVGPRRRGVHSSVSGAAPVFWIDHEGATYFASRIDPLVRAVPGRLDADWEAWSAILSLRTPLGERTPFRQVRRLRPFSLLERTGIGGATTSPPWPWAGSEPITDLATGADLVHEALHETIAPLRGTGVVVLLSGGLDSRMLLGLAHDAGADVLAINGVADDGIGWESRLARDAAAVAGADFEAIEAEDGAEHRRIWLDLLEGSDFLWFPMGFVMPMGPRLAELGLPVLDGLAIDALSARGTSANYTPEMLDPAPDHDFAALHWERMRAKTMGNVVERMLQGRHARAVLRSSRRQFKREAAPFRGLRSRAVLTFYSTRIVRGVATLPMQNMGRFARVLTPGVTNRAGAAMLRIDPAIKPNLALYRAIFDRIESPSVRMPTALDASAPDRKAPERRHSPPMVDLFSRSLSEGPLTPVLGDRLARHLREGTLGEGIRRRPIHRAAMAVTSFHRWCERYASHLATVDPAELLEETRPRSE